MKIATHLEGRGQNVPQLPLPRANDTTSIPELIVLSLGGCVRKQWRTTGGKQRPAKSKKRNSNIS